MKKLSHYVERPESIITGKANLEPLYSFKDFPVFFGCVDSPEANDLTADMDWAIDPETGTIQLTRLIPLEVLYQEQHVDGCGPTWKKYYEDLADYISKQKPKSVLEIGGGQGALAELVTNRDPSITWTIVEPNPFHKGSNQIKIVSAFFDKDFKYPEPVDAVVFSQVLEHAYNPREFIEAIAKFLKPGGKLIFAYPNLELWLGRKYTNALNFEHTMFLTDYFLDYLLLDSGFKTLDKYFYKDHSVFYTTERANSLPKPSLPQNRYQEYKEIFFGFTKYHQEMIQDLNQKITSAQDPIYLFGAHIFAEYLFAFGLNKEKIVTILDNSPTKRGRRLYGTQFVVESPQILKGQGKVTVILKAGIYNEEIKKDILENINPEVTFW